ncbi:uncharacterized protein [Aristolochia californica]|uniref:uncharacterized protein isoform X2 n=1 Tax=Aristolochia californica TaxID=171875 RepID=UPI0035E04FFA
MAPSLSWDNEEEIESEGDDAFDEDMEALKRACMLTGKNPDEINDSTDRESEDENAEVDDLDLVRSIQERFPIPLAVMPPPLGSTSKRLVADSDDEDDFETLRAIERRFAKYITDSSITNSEKDLEKALVGSSTNNNNGTGLVNNDFGHKNDVLSIFHPYPYSGGSSWNQTEHNMCHLSLLPLKNSSFPESAHRFIEAIKKNRACQKFIRRKLTEIEAKISENKQLVARIKCLMDFQLSCKRKGSRILGQYKDPCIKLISLPKGRNLKSGKVKDKKIPVMCTGPQENSQVQNYKMVLAKCPVSFHRRHWSSAEKENLAKGIKQQIQEMLLQKALEQYRWLNWEDPMICHNPWTRQEDKKLLSFIQERGIYNWIEIATLLGASRTPCQCLIRYQRSLNGYSVNKDWTKDEDAQLRAVVGALGEDDWQLIASHLKGRTGRQCYERWLKALHPSRKRVGRWTVDEDKHLKVSVLLFGAKTWQKIARFVPGRTQVQCRERWCNVLDPSLNLEAWTEEEDFKLKAAITQYGRCWSKVAAFVPPRTDNQCRRRWKVLFRHEVPLVQAAWKIQRGALLTNFVDREVERPALSPNDFCLALDVSSLLEEANEKNKKSKRKQKVRNISDENGDANQNHKSRCSKRKANACGKKTSVTTEHLPQKKTKKSTLVSKPKMGALIEFTENLNSAELEHSEPSSHFTANVDVVESLPGKIKGKRKQQSGSDGITKRRKRKLEADDTGVHHQVETLPGKKRNKKKKTPLVDSGINIQLAAEQENPQRTQQFGNLDSNASSPFRISSAYPAGECPSKESEACPQVTPPSVGLTDKVKQRRLEHCKIARKKTGQAKARLSISNRDSLNSQEDLPTVDHSVEEILDAGVSLRADEQPVLMEKIFTFNQSIAVTFADDGHVGLSEEQARPMVTDSENFTPRCSNGKSDQVFDMGVGLGTANMQVDNLHFHQLEDMVEHSLTSLFRCIANPDPDDIPLESCDVGDVNSEHHGNNHVKSPPTGAQQKQGTTSLGVQ